MRVLEICHHIGANRWVGCHVPPHGVRKIVAGLHAEALEQRQSRTRDSEQARDGNLVANLSTRSQQSSASGQIAKSRHRNHDRVGSSQVTAHDTAARRHLRTRVANTVGDHLEKSHGSVSGRGQGNRERRGACAHGHHIGQIAHGRLHANLIGKRPVARKVFALNHGVGGHHKTPVGSRHNRGVISRAQQCGISLGQSRKNARQNLTLAQFAQQGSGQVGNTHPTTVA